MREVRVGGGEQGQGCLLSWCCGYCFGHTRVLVDVERAFLFRLLMPSESLHLSSTHHLALSLPHDLSSTLSSSHPPPLCQPYSLTFIFHMSCINAIVTYHVCILCVREREREKERRTWWPSDQMRARGRTHEVRVSLRARSPSEKLRQSMS